MARTINATTLAEIDNDAVSMCHLVEFNFPTVLYKTDWSHDIIDGSTTYDGDGLLLRIDSVSESSEVRVGTLNIELSGAMPVSGTNGSYMWEHLTNASNKFLNTKVTIYRAFLDANESIVGAKIMIYEGYIDGFDMSESKNESIITLSVASHWSDFERKSGRYTNPNSQALFNSSDKGFDFAAVTVKDLKWGRP